MADFVIPAPPIPSIPVERRRRVSRCAAFIASGATMPPTPSRWVTIRTASRPSSSRRIRTTSIPPATFPYPPHSSDVHHEVELVVALKSGGTNIAVADALGHVWGYAVSLDMTRRDLQNEAKKLGRPWEIAKAFERSGPVGPLKPVSKIGHPDQGRIELKVNGALKQEGDMNQMIWKVPEMIAYLSEYFELQAGDIIMSGTPSGLARWCVAIRWKPRSKAWAR